jgi:diguanylate cyclase (GGDEF)-like protein/putative nucleotidyltransferase with HDIG domain
MLALLTLLSGSFTVRIPGVSARLSVSDTFVFAAVLMFGPAAATMIVVLDTLVISFWLGRTSVPASRLLFNVAAPAFAIWGASHIFYAISGIQPLSITPKPVLSIALPLLALATLYFLLNSWLIAFAVASQKRESAYIIWKKNFLWLSLNYFSGASVAALLLPYLLQANTYESFLYVTGVLLPVLLIFYLTFKAALGRVEDANRHLSELNRLYLSTIETLAMAIDAKDQITHGHIRRVQQYAVSLAKHIGVTETAQISAIEAASLLHDMGKLAVPEYILNKPGRLTAAEFEKMKLHASVGADILSAIDFPYPVVPIVRHHHECWDGTGYPDGLSGTDIPIGARILSVVDCFDALTSDRPYRPRLPDGEAIKILVNRRGSMYDPLIVDAFIAVHASLAPDLSEGAHVERPGLSAITRGAGMTDRQPQVSRFDEIAASTEEMLVLYDLAKSLTTNIELADVGDVISKHLRRVIPASICAFYILDSDLDELVMSYATGENSSNLIGLRMPRGERLTGWVAANKQTIVNSDPILDLGDIARSAKPRLHSCLSTPLLANDQLIGVLTVYSTNTEAFSEDHRRIIEVVARQVSSTIKHALDFEKRRSTHFRDQSTGLPNALHLRELVASELSSLSGVSIVVIRIRSHTGNAKSGTKCGDALLESVANAVKRGLRGGDLLFRYGADEFLVLLTQTDAETAEAVAERISNRFTEEFASVEDRQRPIVTMGIATAPIDGLTIDALVSSAINRERPAVNPPSHPSIH